MRSQKLLEKIPHLAWLMTHEGDILVSNRRWQDYISQAGEAPSLLRFDELLKPEDSDRFLHLWNTAKQSQESLETKFQLQNMLGEWEWFSIELEPDLDDLGETIWIGTAIRLAGNSAIPGSQSGNGANTTPTAQFLEALLDHASDGIVACDADGQLVLFNRTAQRFHGLPPEPIDSDEWGHYYGLYDGEGVRTLAKEEIPLYRALQGETVASQEMMIQSKQNGSRSLLASGSAIYSTTGEKLGAVALMRDITSFKKAMAALQESEQRFRAIFDGTFQFIGLLTPDGTIVEINRTAVKFAGMEDNEGVGRPFWEAPCWSYSLPIQQQLQKAIALAAQGEFVRYEVELMGVGDHLTPIDFSLMPIQDAQGEVILLIPEGRDLSQIKRAETERLRAQLYSERLSIAMRVAKAAAWTWDVKNQTILRTPEFETLFDYEPGTTKTLYSEWLDRVHPDDRAQIQLEWQDTIDRKSPEFRSEYRIVWRDGQIRWIDAIGELHYDDQGNVQGLSGLVYDITDRKQSEIAVQASEEFFRHTFEQTSVGFCHVALDGTWLRVNRKMCEILGYSEEELLATTFQAITEPSDLSMDLALLQQLLEGEIREYTLEKRYIHQQGHSVWANLTVALVRSIAPDGQLGTPQYFISVIQDISDRKQLESLNQKQTADLKHINHSLILTQQHLKDRNDELDRFVHVVSHDLKAPLRAIANLSEWMEEDFISQSPEASQQQLQLLRQRVTRMDLLIDGLLRYSRIGRQQLEIESVDVAQLLSETIDSLSPPAGFKIATLSPLPTLQTKRILLSQVFSNLLSNAIKHHDKPNGRIEIAVEDIGDRYQFSIADDGPGIPEGEARTRIFEIFHTLQPKASSENTGIGLALVKKIVEDEGGQLWLDEAHTEGSRFIFTWCKA